MQRQIIPALLVCSIVLSSGIATAQQPLDAFLDSANTRALDVRQANAALSQARAQIEQARGRLLPSFVAQGIYNYNNSPVVISPNPFIPGGPPINIQLQDQLSASFTANVPLVDLQGWGLYFQFEANAGAASANADLARLNVASSVVQLWHNLVTARALVDAAQRSQSVAEEQLRNVSARVEVGMGAQINLARATAEVERSRQVVAEAELQATLAARNLDNLSGLTPTDTAVQLDDDGHAEQPLERFLTAVDEAPAVRAAEAARSAAEASRNAAWLNLAPTVTGSIQERSTNAAGLTVGNQWMMFLTATFTLDYVRPSMVAVQDAALGVAAVQAERAEQQVSTAIFEAWHRVRTARVQLESARAAEQASERASIDAIARFEAGQGTQIEQIQAQRDRFQSEVARIQATANLRVARAALRLQAGLPIDSRSNPTPPPAAAPETD